MAKSFFSEVLRFKFNIYFNIYVFFADLNYVKLYNVY